MRSSWSCGRAAVPRTQDLILKTSTKPNVLNYCLKSFGDFRHDLIGFIATDPFANVTLSDVEEAAPESSLIELSDDDIEVD